VLTYRKVVFTSPWKVEIQRDGIDDTKIPADHVLLRKTYSLISAGTELACLSGNEGWFPLPGVPGYCSVGEIVKKGVAVNDYEVGDKIFCYGNHSEYELIQAAGVFLKVPEGIGERYVPFVRMATIAATAVRTSNIEFGDFVAVTGQGLVGNIAGQLARLQGAFTIVLDICQKRLELAKKCGADYIINPATSDAKTEISKITGGRMVSTLIDATGSPAVVAANLDIIAQNGEMILLGSPRGEYRSDLTPVLNKCHLAPFNIAFKGAHEWKYPVNELPFVKHSLERNSKIMFQLIGSGRLRMEALLSRVLKPEHCQEAYDQLRNCKDDSMGIVFDWTK
jgi:2-desacetyl-2-hydroxyethyl bacteriochlorophyllide A dehydrogenase